MQRFARLGAILVLLATLVGTAATGSALADDTVENPYFDSLTPAPYTAVVPGPVLIGVHAYSDVPVAHVTLSLDGTQIEEIGSESEDFLAVSQQRVLTAGVHTATVSATDTEGKSFNAQWDFVVSNDANEGEWFTGSGTPKADQINATIRSLVEAFRWHLYGLSWDGANHPDLPTHVGLQGTGDPLTPWVTGTTFDQENTEATLRSLVEAFRWHFWGISWDGANHPDVPTHASSVLPPQAIDPWFTDSGDPIPANITATLRSLVESFRWHFWGYSWDGQHHPDIPTHAVYGMSVPEPGTDVLYQSSLTDVGAITTLLGSKGANTANGYALTVLPNVTDEIEPSNQTFGDGTYSLTMRKVTPDGGAVGCLVLRINHSVFGGQYRACFVYSGTSLTEMHLVYLSGPLNINVEDLFAYTFDPPLNGAEWNTITVTAVGNQFWLYANGVLIDSLYHTGNPSGKIGFAVYNVTSDMNETIEFTNLKVTVPQTGT